MRTLAETGDDIGERRVEPVEIGLLRQIANSGPRLQKTLARIGLDQAGGDLEQSRFARTVAPDEAKPLARPEREFGVDKQRRAAEAQTKRLQGKKRRSHDLGSIRVSDRAGAQQEAASAGKLARAW